MLNRSSAPSTISGCYFCFNLFTNDEIRCQHGIQFCPVCEMDSIMKFSMCLSNGDILIALENKAKLAWRIHDEDEI